MHVRSIGGHARFLYQRAGGSLRGQDDDRKE